MRVHILHPMSICLRMQSTPHHRTMLLNDKDQDASPDPASDPRRAHTIPSSPLSSPAPASSTSQHRSRTDTNICRLQQPSESRCRNLARHCTSKLDDQRRELQVQLKRECAHPVEYSAMGDGRTVARAERKPRRRRQSQERTRRSRHAVTKPVRKRSPYPHDQQTATHRLGVAAAQSVERERAYAVQRLRRELLQRLERGSEPA